MGRTHDETNVVMCIFAFIISSDLYVDNSYVFMKQKIPIVYSRYIYTYTYIQREMHTQADFFPEPLQINLYTSLSKKP